MVYFELAEYENVFESQVSPLSGFWSEINRQSDLQQGQDLAKR